MAPKLLLLLIAACILNASCNNDGISNQTSDDTLDLSSVSFVDSVDPASIITREEARNMVQNFEDYMRTVDPNATKAVWIDRRLFLEFAKRLNSHDSFDGVRIYFGKYSGTHPETERQNKLTLFLLGTYDSSGYHRDTFLFKKNEKAVALEALSINHGELCPKLCCGSFYYPCDTLR